MNFSSLAKAAGSVVDAAKAKAKDVAHDAAAITNRVTQHALESAGMGDKSEEDETLPSSKTPPARPASARSTSTRRLPALGVRDGGRVRRWRTTSRRRRRRTRSCSRTPISTTRARTSSSPSRCRSSASSSTRRSSSRSARRSRGARTSRSGSRSGRRCGRTTTRTGGAAHGLHSDPGNAATYEANLENARDL